LSLLELAELHLDVLYERDAGGMIVRQRGTVAPPPDFHLVRTIEGNRWALSVVLPGDRRARLEEALIAEPIAGSLEALETNAPAVGSVIGGSEGPDAASYRGPAFLFPQTLPIGHPDVDLLLDARDAHAVPELAWVQGVTPEEQPACVARNGQGEIVSVCHAARATETAAEAGVETAAEYRGLGLGTAVVATWALALMLEGRLPLFSTQWTNLPSRAIARKLELLPYGEDYHVP
jgi:hypothetical protein